MVVEARDLARVALQEARRSVWDLRPKPLEATGLAAALGVEAARWQERSGISVRLRSHLPPRDLGLPPEVEVACFRIVQEALSNAARHSRAEHVEVRIERRGDHLCIAVTDDGVGFDITDGATPGRFGLVGMRERARLIGADLAVESHAGEGTRLELTLPWPVPQPETEAASA
jgi:signal transduction histidine kinase